MNFQQVQKLDVKRKLSDGSQVIVGELAQNRQGVYFQYNDDYLTHYSNLSPFNLSFDPSLQVAPLSPHNNLHGAFSDSLPDGWGLLLMDRIFRQSGILQAQITSMDRLSFIGDSAMGALSFSPISSLKNNDTDRFSLAELGIQAQAIFDGQTEEVLQALVNTGSSGGARPKAQLYLNDADPAYCSTKAADNNEAYLVKFTSSQLALGHEEGLCEAAYLTLADIANIDVPEWKLLDAPEQSGATKWLALKRFDVIKNNNGVEGRHHLHSASGLLDADFRMPTLDYEDLIKATSLLCKSPAKGQVMFKRMIFNLFSLNQDDHSKNWAFLQADNGKWDLAPFYDITFSPSSYNEHATAFSGYGKQPSLKVMQKLAKQANFSSWKNAQEVIQEVVESLSQFSNVAKQLNINSETTRLMSNQLNNVYTDNKHLLVR
jgi:serine/threonine-protein kinase HipA